MEAPEVVVAGEVEGLAAEVEEALAAGATVEAVEAAALEGLATTDEATGVTAEEAAGLVAAVVLPAASL